MPDREGCGEVVAAVKTIEEVVIEVAARFFGKKKGLKQLPKSLFLLVELIRIELTTS